MAKLIGTIRIRGTIDNMTFLETKYGMLVRKRRRQIPKEVFRNDPVNKRFMENSTEFGHAARSARLFRTVVADAMLNCSDKEITGRLVSSMMKVVKSDAVNRRGSRNIMKGQSALMKDFNFNQPAELSMVFKKAISTMMDRSSGKMVMILPGFVPEEAIAWPPGTTHFRFHSLAAEINFDTGYYRIKQYESGPLRNDDFQPIVPISFIHELTPNSTNPIFLLLGIRFYELMNGYYYPFKNNAFNALSIVDAGSV